MGILCLRLEHRVFCFKSPLAAVECSLALENLTRGALAFDAFFLSGVWIPITGLGFLTVLQLLSQPGDLTCAGAHLGLALVLLVCYLSLIAPS